MKCFLKRENLRQRYESEIYDHKLVLENKFPLESCRTEDLVISLSFCFEIEVPNDVHCRKLVNYRFRLQP